VTCSNCARPDAEHCTRHAVPCCPGKCPGDLLDPVRLFEAARKAGAAAERTRHLSARLADVAAPGEAVQLDRVAAEFDELGGVLQAAAEAAKRLAV
jgi:hypothetical protein